MTKTRSERQRMGFEGAGRRRAAAVWPRPKRRRKDTGGDVVAEEAARLVREGNLALKIGSQRLLEAMEMDQDLQTQEAVASVLGSRRSATRSSTSHGGGDGGG